MDTFCSKSGKWEISAKMPNADRYGICVDIEILISDAILDLHLGLRASLSFNLALGNAITQRAFKHFHEWLALEYRALCGQ